MPTFEDDREFLTALTEQIMSGGIMVDEIENGVPVKRRLDDLPLEKSVTHVLGFVQQRKVPLISV